MNRSLDFLLLNVCPSVLVAPLPLIFYIILCCYTVYIILYIKLKGTPPAIVYIVILFSSMEKETSHLTRCPGEAHYV